jgi:hypothetical protein
MSEREAEAQIGELLRQGVEAARAGNKAVARALLEQVVALDQHHEKGWFWLAAVSDDLHEKITCLGNVLVINPDNARAQSLLARLEGGTIQGVSPATTPSARQRPSRRMLGVGAALGAVVVVALLVILMGGDGDDGATQRAADSGGPGPAGLTVTPAEGAAAQPTPTFTSPPPTWTPVPSETPSPDAPPILFPPPPSSLPGQIIMRSGHTPGDPGNQPIVLIRPDGSGARTLSAPRTRGHAPVLAPDGSQYAYILYTPGTRDFLLQLDNLQGTDPRPASSYWTGDPTLLKQESPAWSPDGEWIAFSAQGLGAATTDLFRLAIVDRRGDPAQLERLTDDNAIESWPAYSPDGTQIVYAADQRLNVQGGATDLYLLDVATGQTMALTTNGAGLVEAAPDWSPDGQTIVFQAAAAGSATNDIYRISPAGGTAELLIASDADDIKPRFSPDGRFIVFSSNRTGNWDVFVYELDTEELYQVTSAPHTDVANDWGP